MISGSGSGFGISGVIIGSGSEVGGGIKKKVVLNEIVKRELWMGGSVDQDQGQD